MNSESQAAEAQFRFLVESAEDAIVLLSLEGRILSWNPAAERLFGHGRDEMVGRSNWDLFAPADLAAALTAVRKGRSFDRYELIPKPASGEPTPVSIIVSPVRDGDGVVFGVSVIARDLTPVRTARELEEQFRQAQRLESLGRLAGGVAHDFNNLLMIITGFTQMIEERLSPEDALRSSTQQILKAAERGAGLIRQLLAFSRRQALAPQVMDVNSVVDDTARMIRRLIGQNIELTLLLDTPLWNIKSDPGQITQVLLNLCLNARDAMPQGGRLTVKTQNAIVDREQAQRHKGRAPGAYVLVTVTDTGVGMSHEVQQHMFEPFYTTKAMGKGTGLGLATVYGIVSQSGGFITVHSLPGRGTSFDLYFPRVEQSGWEISENEDYEVRGRGEIVLVAENDALFREELVHNLKNMGYAVLQGADGEEALRVAQSYLGPLDLLVANVIMPRMGGSELARRLESIHPAMLTLFISGYSDEAITASGRLEEGQVLHKPFAMRSLGLRLRQMLAARPGAAA